MAFQTFRQATLQRAPYILELYYMVGEAVEPDNRIRDWDKQVWAESGKR